MPRPSSDYTRCPQCGHRTVLFHFGRNGEDYLKCRCGWNVFRWADNYDSDDDRAERQRWLDANPGIEGEASSGGRAFDS